MNARVLATITLTCLLWMDSRVAAQEGVVLPLQPGNWWQFSVIRSSSVRPYADIDTTIGPRIEVQSAVRLRSVPADTIVSHDEGLNDNGVEYYRLVYGVRLGWLNTTHTPPDTLFVRVGADGGLLLGGYSRGEKVYLAHPERQWLVVDGPQMWSFDEIAGDHHVPGLVMERFREEQPESLLRFIDTICGRRAGCREREIFDIFGRVDGCADCFAGGKFLEGIGPLVMPGGAFEFVSTRYQLAEAFVGGEHYGGGAVTAIKKEAWSGVKLRPGGGHR